MFCVLVLTAMRKELDYVHSESSNDILISFYKPAFDMLVGRLDTKIYIEVYSLSAWKIEVGW